MRHLDLIEFLYDKLKREKFGPLDLHGLKSGEYRHLSVKEVKTLYSLVKK